MSTFKKCLPDLLAVLLFVVLSFAYFFPADTEGRILYRHDSAAGAGFGKDAAEYSKQTGNICRWTNSAFCGMPTYQSAPSYKSLGALDTVAKAYHLWLPDYVWYLFAYMLGFYILLRAFDFRQTLAALGSVIWAFSTYFLIIIAAGHYWKVMALAYLPPMIAGIILAYRGKYLWGLVVTAIFTALEVQANHVQMTYYYLFVIIAMVVAFLVDSIRKHQMRHFMKAAGVCAAGALVGVLINISNLYHTWEYSKESMRGKSELVKANAANQTSSGLDRDYITQWSYGIDETLTLLIPNAKGGASEPLVLSKKAMEKADNNYLYIGQQMYPYMYFYQQLSQYWGDQPFTSGPVYVGAFVMFLFLLGLFIVKGPVKWALFAATILSILLSWGHNFMPFTDFFLDYVPMYAKFRTVASILVIAEFTIPLLAMLALKKVIDEPDYIKKHLNYLYVSFALTAGLCLLLGLFPGIFDYTSRERLAFAGEPADQVMPFLANLTEMRKAVFTADCYRSLLFICAGCVLLFFFLLNKLKTQHFVGLVLVLCLVDLWAVNKRYLNDEMFVEASVKNQPVRKDGSIDLILRDKSLGYRVLNLSVDSHGKIHTFSENETSYYVNSIGGYHAAKLRRYQELVDAHVHKEINGIFSAVSKAQGDMTKVNGDSIFPVLNMLNAKYFIFPLGEGQTVPLTNPYVYGSAWMVDKVTYVDNANKELAALDRIPLRHVAVADKKFSDVLGNSEKQEGESLVTLKSYAPNNAEYEVHSTKGGVVVFSEIYYPGWTATVDGEPAELGRVNYVLRAVKVKPGNHKIVLSFDPQTVKTTETIAYVAYAFLILILLLLALRYYRAKSPERAK